MLALTYVDPQATGGRHGHTRRQTDKETDEGPFQSHTDDAHLTVCIYFIAGGQVQRHVQ